MIRFQCNSCEKKLKVPVEYAERKVKCPKCASVLLVPEAEDVPAVENTEEDSGLGNLRDALSGLESGETIEHERPVKKEPEPAARKEPELPFEKAAPSSESSGEGKKFVLAIIFCIAFGIGGAMLWAAIAKFTGMEIGYVAWGVGAAVGVGVILSGAEQCQKLGIIAAVIAVGAILGGKLLVINWIYEEEMSDVNASFASMSDQEILDQIESKDALLGIAMFSLIDDDMAMRMEADAVSPAEQDQLEQEAKLLAESWSEQEIIDNTRDYFEKIMSEFSGEVKSEMMKEGFLASFGIMDIVFIGLAVVTAYKLGEGRAY